MEKAKCRKCLKEYAVKKNGEIRKHACFEATALDRAADAGASPLELLNQAAEETAVNDDAQAELDEAEEPTFEQGPWHGALSACICFCGAPVAEGDQVRDVGGSESVYFECKQCANDPEPAPVVELRIPAEPGPMPTPEEFMDEFDTPAPAGPKLNVSGQPDARRDWLGRYIVVDPELGDFRRTAKGKPVGLTRVTTFVKAAMDSTALNDWQKRNVLIGAVRRPDVVRQAHNLTHERDKDTLQRLVGQLEDAAGAKVSADEGTFLHEFTEHMDAGDCTWEDAAPQYQQSLKLYTQTLVKYGLEPVPGLIERTVMVKEFGGIVGTFDRVMFHRPSGTYVIVDLKTGKTLKYGYSEIEAQEWMYAHGINQGGVYDWNTDVWSPVGDPMTRGPHPDGVPIKVREDVGVIIHMPVQGPDEGRVLVRKADLVAGKAYAELCDDVRSHPKAKVKEWDEWWIDWEAQFRSVSVPSEASQLWQRARETGVAAERLSVLVSVAQHRLSELGF